MRPTIRIVMTRTAKGCPDSTTVVEYEDGREYEVPADLAEAFFSMGAADPAEAHEAADEAEAGADAAVDAVATDGQRPPPPPNTPDAKGDAPKRTRKAR